MQRIAERGIEVLIPPDTSRKRTTRRNLDGGRYDEMREALASERGGQLYRKRQPMIEPVFAQMKSTAAWTASDDEDAAPSAPNGALSPPPTICSSSTATRSRPPDGRRPPGTRTRRPKWRIL